MPATDVTVPNLGESVTEATLIKYYKADGESVEADEPIAELETDKANADVPAPAAGVFRRTKEEGDTVAVGEAIGTVDPEGTASAKPAPTDNAASSNAQKPPGKPEATQPTPSQPAPSQPAPSQPAATAALDMSPTR